MGFESLFFFAPLTLIILSITQIAVGDLLRAQKFGGTRFRWGGGEEEEEEEEEEEGEEEWRWWNAKLS